MLRKTAAVAATLSLMAAPAAVAQETQEPSSKSPGQACKTMSKKKNSAGKGKTMFAVCVTGFARAEAKNEANEQRKARGQKPVRVIPGQVCKSFKGQPKAPGQTKTPFAACVKGATEANKKAREAARQQPAPAPVA